MAKKTTKLFNQYYFKVGEMYVENATIRGTKVTLTKDFSEAWKCVEDLLYAKEDIEHERFSEDLRRDKEWLMKDLLLFEEKIKKAGLTSTLHVNKVEQTEEGTELEWVNNHALQLELRPKSE